MNQGGLWTREPPAAASLAAASGPGTAGPEGLEGESGARLGVGEVLSDTGDSASSPLGRVPPQPPSSLPVLQTSAFAVFTNSGVLHPLEVQAAHLAPHAPRPGALTSAVPEAPGRLLLHCSLPSLQLPPGPAAIWALLAPRLPGWAQCRAHELKGASLGDRDRKSTRLNSSH